jgi:hypothetical protein
MATVAIGQLVKKLILESLGEAVAQGKPGGRDFLNAPGHDARVADIAARIEQGIRGVERNGHTVDMSGHANAISVARQIVPMLEQALLKKGYTLGQEPVVQPAVSSVLSDEEVERIIPRLVAAFLDDFYSQQAAGGIQIERLSHRYAGW